MKKTLFMTIVALMALTSCGSSDKSEQEQKKENREVKLTLAEADKNFYGDLAEYLEGVPGEYTFAKDYSAGKIDVDLNIPRQGDGNIEIDSQETTIQVLDAQGKKIGDLHISNYTEIESAINKGKKNVTATFRTYDRDTVEKIFAEGKSIKMDFAKKAEPKAKESEMADADPAESTEASDLDLDKIIDDDAAKDLKDAMDATEKAVDATKAVYDLYNSLP